MPNSQKIRARIVEEGLTQRELAKIIGVSENTLTSKLNGRRDFCVGEINAICDALHISDNSTKAQFFLG